MSYEFVGFAPQGWQCPVCGAVYSPAIMQCLNCVGWKATNTTSSTTGGAIIDWLHHDSVTKVENEKAGKANEKI